MEAIFGPYELVYDLDVGSSCELRIGHKSDHKSPILMKMLNRESMSSPELVKAFALEIQHNQALPPHPNISQFVDASSYQGRDYLVLEYIRGASVDQILSKQPISPQAAILIIMDICAGLTQVHNHQDNPMIHCDITPSNIVIDTDGVAKLIDFGVAVPIGYKNPGRGTYAYMSPEQVQGQSLTEASDQFSLAIILWELLSQARLFRRAESHLTIAAVVEAPIPPVSLHTIKGSPNNAETYKEIRAVCQKALSRLVHKRFASCMAFGEALAIAAQSAQWLGFPAKQTNDKNNYYRKELANLATACQPYPDL